MRQDSVEREGSTMTKTRKRSLIWPAFQLQGSVALSLHFGLPDRHHGSEDPETQALTGKVGF